MIFQYLLVPIFGLGNAYQYNFEYYKIATAGILSFVIGSKLVNHCLTSKSNNLYVNISSVDERLIICTSILFFLLGFIVKAKKIWMLGGFDLDTVYKPNMLHVASFVLFSLYIIIKQKKSQLPLRMAIGILICSFLLINFWFLIAAVGRASIIYIIVSIVLSYYMFYNRINKFYLVIPALLILIVLIGVGYIKALHFNQVQNTGFSIDNHILNSFINRISQSHILLNVLLIKPPDLSIGFYGFEDIIRFPFLGMTRYYLSGQDFGHAFNLIGNADFVTGVAPSFIGDLYLRVSSLWMLVAWMAIVGVCYGLIEFSVVELDIKYSLPLIVLLFPYLLYGTEEFIFLTIATLLLMFSFFFISIRAVDCMLQLYHKRKLVCLANSKLINIYSIMSLIFLTVVASQLYYQSKETVNGLTLFYNPLLDEFEYVELFPSDRNEFKYKYVKKPELFVTTNDFPIIKQCLESKINDSKNYNRCMGVKHSYGLGVGKSLNAALDYFNLAKNEGDSWSSFHAARLEYLLNHTSNTGEICNFDKVNDPLLALQFLEDDKCDFNTNKKLFCDSANTLYKSRFRHTHREFIIRIWSRCGLNNNIKLYSNPN